MGSTSTVNSDTEIEGDLIVGVRVKVEALLQGDVLVAVEIEVKGQDEDDGGEDESQFKFDGIIASFTDIELVLEGDIFVLLNADTKVIGTLFEGLEVEVKAVASEDGSLLALKVKVENDLGFEGTITTLSETELEIDGEEVVLLTLATNIVKGPLALGDEVEVDAEASTGVLVVYEGQSHR